MAIKEMRSLNFGGPDTYVPVPTDWNQTDETQPDFLKNKPFGDVPMVFFEEQEIIFEGGEGVITVLTQPSVGSNVTVVWDGVDYVCQTSTYMGFPFVGNGQVNGNEDTGEPFAIVFASTAAAIVLCIDSEKASAVVKISGTGANRIDPKYVASMTKFYISDDTSDVYLYTDLGLTTKATAADLRRAVLSTPITISLSEVYLFHPVNIASSIYGIVNIYDLSTKLTSYFTAEYTPQ